MVVCWGVGGENDNLKIILVKYLENISPFRGATDTFVLELW